MGVGLAAACLALFWPTLRWMAERFDAHDSFYSHGWLVPFASGWLIWRRRDLLERLSLRPSYAGLMLLVPSLLVHLAATWLRVGFVSGIAMLTTIWGLVWTFWGWPALCTLRFPMVYLLFMVPLPGVFLINVSFQMKLMAASLATHGLHLLGLSATQAGSTIQVPGASVIVDDVCSGLRSLISLIALATLWSDGLPLSSAAWKRVMIIGSSIPIALVANMVRILTLVLLAAIYGPDAAEGFLHYGSGVVVFLVALLVLAWMSRLLQQWSPPSLDLGHSPSSS